MEDFGTDSGIKEAPLRAKALEDVAFRATRKVLEALLRDRRLAKDLGPKFRPTLSRLVRVEISRLNKDDGAFTIEGTALRLNENDVARLFAYVISDIKSELAMGKSVDPSEIQETLEDTLSLFALHEIRHCTQGVGKYRTVQALKSIDGGEQQSKFDILADRDAALALASTKTQSSDCDEFLLAYQNALYYSVQYFFKIYPAKCQQIRQNVPHRSAFVDAGATSDLSIRSGKARH